MAQKSRYEYTVPSKAKIIVSFDGRQSARFSIIAKGPRDDKWIGCFIDVPAENIPDLVELLVLIQETK